MMCSLKGEYVSISHEACDRFSYDIFKRPVRRRKKNTSGKFKPEDFQL